MTLNQQLKFLLWGVLVAHLNVSFPEDSCSYFARLCQINPELLVKFKKKISDKYNTLWHDIIIKQNVDSRSLAKIPKTIHIIWFGKPMPTANLEKIETWKKHHPNWMFCQWDDAMINREFKAGLQNQHLFDRAMSMQNYAQASDIARYEILERFGGLYIDSDVYCHKRFDVFHENFDFYIGMEGGLDTSICGNAIIGSTKNHPVLRKVITNIKKGFDSHHNEFIYENVESFFKEKRGWFYDPNTSTKCKVLETIALTGPGCLTKSLASYYFQQDDEITSLTLVLPKEYFYSGEGSLFANHLFEGSWWERTPSNSIKQDLQPQPQKFSTAKKPNNSLKQLGLFKYVNLPRKKN